MEADDTLIFATRNHDKAREFESLLGEFINPSWRVFDIANWHDTIPEVVEDQETFWGNSVKKAFKVSRHTGSVALSDDSGLEVDALEGAPGVYSARYAGPNATDDENNRILIKELEGVPEKKRTARYVCVAALAIPENKIGRALMARSGVPFEEIGRAELSKEGSMVRMDDRIVVWFRGTVEGLIIDQPRGTEGFGYDPHFYVPKWDKTMAEVPLEQKNTISHRAEALRKMAAFFSGRP